MRDIPHGRRGRDDRITVAGLFLSRNSLIVQCPIQSRISGRPFAPVVYGPDGVNSRATIEARLEIPVIRVRLAPVLRVLVLLGLSGGTVFGQTTRPPESPLMISSTRGQDLFAFYCAPCHGPGGKGDGPVAPSLRTPAADLTTIATRNGGTFPAARVESQVTGTGTTLIVSHGTREMPVWGPIFRAFDPNSDEMNKVRIANLIRYLESLQVK
jgi:mono/diheme cytochrome c family protein